ncbi:MAG: putative immunity protein [Chthoniobacterales bacterium]
MKVEGAPKSAQEDQRTLALWAAECAAHVLPLFEKKHAKDDLPRKAIEAARAWTRGELSVSQARAAAFPAHAAARDCDDAAGRAAARSAGHAAATAHLAGHARYAAAYAVTASKAIDAAHPDAAAATERHWQFRRLPEHLRAVGFASR